MKKLLIKITVLIIPAFSSMVCLAQDVNRTADYDPEKNKIIPDKVFEIGLPLLTVILVLNIFFNVIKTRMANRLKEKALDKNLSEAALIALFNENVSVEKAVYLKWFIILLSLGLSFFVIYFVSLWADARSPYIAGGILCVFLSIGFFIFHRLLNKR